MLKINLLEGKEVPFEEEKPEIKESEFLSAEDFVPKEEKIDMVEQEPAEKAEPLQVEEDHVESASETPKPVVAEKQPAEETAEIEDFHFQKKSSIPIVPIVALLAIAFLLFAYFKFFSNQKTGQVPAKVAVEDTTKKPAKSPAQEVTPKTGTTPETVKAKTVPTATAQGTKPSAGAKGLATEKKAGFTAVNLFGKILTAVPSGARIAFLSFNSGYFTIELYARKKETLNTFLQKAKASVPSFSYKIVSSDRGLYNGARMQHMIISGQIALSGSAVASGSVLGSKKSKAAILALARTDHVRVREIRKSPLVTNENGKRIPITVKISAPGKSLQKFLVDLLNQYRNVGVSRILISASRTKGGAWQDAALDLNLFPE